MSRAMTPSQIISALLQLGVEEGSILDWHRCLVDTPPDVLRVWIQTIKSDTAAHAATMPPPSPIVSSGSRLTATHQAPEVEHGSSSSYVITSLPHGAPQQLHCPIAGCKGRWKGSYTWFVKHFREKHLNDYWYGMENVAWRCLCGVDFANDKHLMTHIWQEHVVSTSSQANLEI
ncbi:hypothetical protein FB567DRAFT_248985 [Paraphoma chrysanthemicola]|uniref:Uncharacterized protein n=1 Tax=Paraphoma chrysanthemicola TaxID=798071 RepID=A0A8K0VSH0_9PLEO|nr:hypothetical protein FB567DRAFT_248985 [Paraphoma chrysanthemicola]